MTAGFCVLRPSPALRFARDGSKAQGKTQILYFVLIMPQPVRHFMPHDLFHFGRQVSLGTAQNGASKDEYKVGCRLDQVVLALGSANATKASQQLGTSRPFSSLRHLFEHLLGWFVDDLNPREVWQVSDLLGQRIVCPFDDFLEPVSV